MQHAAVRFWAGNPHLGGTGSSPEAGTREPEPGCVDIARALRVFARFPYLHAVVAVLHATYLQYSTVNRTT